MADKTPQNDGDSGAWLVMLGLAVLLLVLAPLLLATGVYLGVRRHLTRREGALLALTGLAGYAARWHDLTVGYLGWLKTVALGPDRLTAPPLLPVALLTVAFVGMALLVRGTKLGTVVPDKVSRVLGREKPQPAFGEVASLLPTAEEKERAKIVAPPVVAVDAAQHSLVSPVEAGRREFAIGVDKNGQPVMLSEHELGMHALVFGSTGSGKSTALQALIGQLTDLGWSGAMIDLKEDARPGGMRDWCRQLAANAALPWQELSVSDPTPDRWFNPLAGMGPDDARDTILSLQEFDDAFWQAINKETLGAIVMLFYMAHEIDPTQFPYPHMVDIAKLLAHGAQMPTAAKKMLATVLAHRPDLTKDDFRAVAQPSPQHAQSAQGYAAKINQVYATQAGRVALRPGEGRQLLDITAPGLTYVGLDTQGKADLSKMLSMALLQRVAVWSAQRNTGQVRDDGKRFIVVDEASVLNRAQVHALLTKCRSSNISLILATQSPADFEVGQRDQAGFAALAQNANVTIIMSQGERGAAEVCADLIGMDVQQVSNQQWRDGVLVDQGTVRKEEVYRVTPDELRALQIGEAIVRVGKPTERVSWMAVKQRDPRPLATRRPPAS